MAYQIPSNALTFMVKDEILPCSVDVRSSNLIDGQTDLQTGRPIDTASYSWATTHINCRWHIQLILNFEFETDRLKRRMVAYPVGFSHWELKFTVTGDSD